MTSHPVSRKLRLAMIGGGPGAWIGKVHRKAARMDGRIELVAGAFSSDPAKSRVMGEKLFLDPARVYASWPEMLAAESALPQESRPDIVAIVTPNHLHCAPALRALAAGFHVILEKPLTLDVDEAATLREAVRESGRLMAVTHPFSALSTVRLGRDLIRAGRLGSIRKINAEFRQGWLYRDLENDPGNPQAAWRTDPARSGAGCLGDIGTHIFNLAETFTGMTLLEVAADVSSFVPGRRNDDDFSLLARWEGGAKGVIHASQILPGAESGLFLHIAGDKAGLEWRHSENERLILRQPNQPAEIWTRGAAYVETVSAAAVRNNRSPGTNTEGSQEGFANIYANLADAVLEMMAGRSLQERACDFPGIEEGYRGMLFVRAALASSQQNGAWTRLT